MWCVRGGVFRVGCGVLGEGCLGEGCGVLGEGCLG